MSSVTDPRPEGQSGAVSPSALLAGDTASESTPDILARAVDFPRLTAKPAEGGGNSLERLLDVTVTVSAELGRITLPISSVLSLGVNSILELNRNVSEPIDLMVQGVRLARAEVVVVGDSFAVRIKEIVEPRQGKQSK